MFDVSLNTIQELDGFVMQFQSNDIGSDISNECADAIIKIVCEHNTTLKNVAKVKKSVGAMLDTSHVTNRQSNMATPKFSSETHDKQGQDNTYAGAAGASKKTKPNERVEFCHRVSENIFDGVNISIPRKVVQKGLEDVSEGGLWMVRNSPIILKKWTVKTSLLKEELTHIPVWIKFHDIPLQVFEEEGVSLIPSYLGKSIMMDSITSSMCKDAWGRSSFARCLVEINSDSDFLDTITIGVPDIDGPGFTKETISVEYEWKPPRCPMCHIFRHSAEWCPKKGVTKIVNTTLNTSDQNDGFQQVKSRKRNNKGKTTSQIPRGVP
nr:zinc knuckle CX2CX4HX4C [Tanacetum cinerariifolium]